MSATHTSDAARWVPPGELTPAHQTVYFRLIRIEAAATNLYRLRSAARRTALGNSPNSEW